jgi:hypothetical protein
LGPGTEAAWVPERVTELLPRLLERLLAKTGPKLIATLAGTEVATERLRKELERARYAHVATHGFFADKQFRSVLQSDEKPFAQTMFDDGRIAQRIGEGARCGLVCAGANLPDTPGRGILSADAVAGLLLDDLHLAVLSACDTGIGDVAGGEGVFGLQRAFHIAGCKNVVASLWKVDDAATAALMTRFTGVGNDGRCIEGDRDRLPVEFGGSPTSGAQSGLTGNSAPRPFSPQRAGLFRVCPADRRLFEPASARGSGQRPATPARGQTVRPGRRFLRVTAFSPAGARHDKVSGGRHEAG